ncbi:MAG: hypothetical protein AAFY82_00060 [Pseudomonadota bacterium]
MFDIWVFTGWTAVLFVFAVIAFVGVRNARAPFGATVAAMTASVLVVSGCFAFYEMALVWSGYDPGEYMDINIGTLAGLVTAFLKSGAWVVDGRG